MVGEADGILFCCVGCCPTQEPLLSFASELLGLRGKVDVPVSRNEILVLCD